MAKYRGQLFFQDQNVGWSETYWSLSASSVPDLLTRLIALAKQRVKMLGTGFSGQFSFPGPQLTYLRAEDLDTGIIQIAQGTDAVPQGSKSRSTGVSEVPWSTILLRYQFGGGGVQYRSMRQLSGAPDDAIIDPPGPNLANDWYKNFQLWRTFLINANNGWALPHFTYTALPGITVTAVNWNAGNLVLTFNNPPFNSSPGVVWLRGFKPRQWNGLTTINAALTPPVQVWTTSGKVYKSPIGPIQPGTVNIQSFTLYQITDVIIRGETHRARGRVFGQPRGRRPNKARSA